MVAWLVPISVFWPLAALYLGGAPITIEGGGGVRQIGGLFLHFAAYLLAYGLLRAGFSVLIGPVLGGVIIPIVVASALIPLLGRLSFRAVGVRITPLAGHVTE